MPLRAIAAAGIVLLAMAAPASAVPITSRCLAIAEGLAPVMRVAYRQIASDGFSLRGNQGEALDTRQVRITFTGHSTFVIETPKGIKIATDYAGVSGGILPDVVTMNHAHTSHYTDYPDPRIQHVLRGWNPAGGHAEHNLELEDVYIRNIPTNIRRWYGGGTGEEFGNSIFIFETAGLCIGHLGHLHHELTEQQLGQIGTLDIVMAPVDGSYTLDVEGMVNVLKSLHARLVLPMHYFGVTTLARFIDRLGRDFEIMQSEEPTVVVSRADLPDRPRLLVLPGY